MQTTTRPVLPQEIINLIIDLVASETDNQRERSKTLQACCLVSVSFNYRSKRHLFSEIIFRADESAQKRAQRLLRALDQPANLQCIQSFKLLIDMRSTSLGIFNAGHATRIRQRAGAVLTGLGRTLGVTKNHLLILINRLTCVPLEAFIVEARNGILNLRGVNSDFRSLLLAFRSRPTLKSLHFINIINLDDDLVVQNAPQAADGLQKLCLWNVAFVHSPANGLPAPFSLSNIAYLEGIEHLEWLSYFDLPPVLPAQTFSSQPFSSLKSLTVSFPRSFDLTPFCQLLESLFSLVETLEFRKCPIGPCEYNLNYSRY